MMTDTTRYAERVKLSEAKAVNDAQALRDILASIAPGERQTFNGFQVTRATRTGKLVVLGREDIDGEIEALSAAQIAETTSNGTGYRSSLNALVLSGLLRCDRGRYLPGPVAGERLR